MASKKPTDIYNGLEAIDDDILVQIFSKLAAKSIAFASCVSKSWNRVCGIILSKPKVVSALSMEPNPSDAIQEAVDKILSVPIRPQFVIACFTMSYNRDDVHHEMERNFGSLKIPIITNLVVGVIGNDIQDNELTEVTANDLESECMENEDFDCEMPILGLVLIVGSFPDMQVEAIPLLHLNKIQEQVAVDRFLNNVKNYSMDISGLPSPAAIVLFGEKNYSLTSVLLKNLDIELSKDTAIVGHFNGCVKYRSANEARRRRDNILSTKVVALVFASDKNINAGRTQFHVPCMNNVFQIGPAFYVDTIEHIDREKGTKTHLIAKSCKDGTILNGGSINLIGGMDKRVFFDDLYIGIKKQVAASMKNKEMSSSSSGSSSTILSLHGVEMEIHSRDDLIVCGEGIKVGDTFEFYKSDFKRGLAIRGIPNQGIHNNTEVFGSFIFAHLSKIVARFQRDLISYSIPFVEQFEGMPIAGLFSKNLVKRGSVISAWKNGEYEEVGECATTRKGNTFLVMSYTPPARKSENLK